MPALALKNISIDGEVYNTNKLISNPILDEEVGIKKRELFSLYVEIVIVKFLVNMKILIIIIRNLQI
ncbi:hypothetical protein [Maledivibacter halophilus]|uniref:hypothetical protein n=1 Tax=Maledivibacter halophilus TaxID=36842 RepID=UPI0009A7A57E|nr:hypothetical protein [Maledivibacter halophilus]